MAGTRFRMGSLLFPIPYGNNVISDGIIISSFTVDTVDYFTKIISRSQNVDMCVGAYNDSGYKKTLLFSKVSANATYYSSYTPSTNGITTISYSDSVFPYVQIASYTSIVNLTFEPYVSKADLILAAANYLNGIVFYPIHYFHSDGCTITGPADAAPGQDCVVIVNPASGYVFRGSSGVVIQDSTGANVPFIVSGNRISFTYPQPI